MFKVLIVDDDPHVRKLIAANLKASRYRVITAMNGEEGLRKAAEILPDIILLDIKMPDISGWDLLRALKANPKLTGIPAVVISAIAAERDESKLKEQGASGWLAKPFSAEELLNEVKRALGEK